MDQQVKQILDLYEKLSPEKKKQTLDYMALGLKNANTEKIRVDRDPDMFVGAVLEGLRSILRDESSPIPSPAAIKRYVSSSWEPVESFMETSGLRKMTVQQRQATYNVLAELLVTHARYVAQKSGAPLSAKLTLSCVRSLPGLFENAFPGYLGSGMAHIAILGGSKLGKN